MYISKVLILCIFVSTAPDIYAEQSIVGDCNAQITGNNNVVNIICDTAKNSLPQISESPSQLKHPIPSAKINLQASVIDLHHGSKSFNLLFENKTPDYTVDIPTQIIDISDDLGNTYELDRFAMFSLEFSKKVPPNKRIKTKYILTSPIVSRAKTITFTLDDIWASPKGSSFRRKLPQVQWETRL